VTEAMILNVQEVLPCQFVHYLNFARLLLHSVYMLHKRIHLSNDVAICYDENCRKRMSL